MEEITIQHRDDGKKGAFYYAPEGRLLAEMTYIHSGPDKMIIDHTEVDKSLEGQGIGRKLQEQLVQYVRAGGMKVIPLCPFAKVTFHRVKEWQDVLA
jgi:predicted GNAT family acetyltransferase